MFIKQNDCLVWIPSMLNMHDYIAPGGLGWNDPDSAYAYTVTYMWKHESGETGTRQIRVKHPAHAKIIIDHWNSANSAWSYELL